MSLKVKVGTSIVEAKPKVKVNGSWVDVISGFVKLDGSWKEFYRLGEPQPQPEPQPYCGITTFTSTSDTVTNHRERFGISAAIDGTRLAVVSLVEVERDDFTFGIKVYIYEWNGTTYNVVTTLTLPHEVDWWYYGAAVALEGTRLVVGSPHDSIGGIAGAGRVYIYEWNGTSYDEVATLTAPDAREDSNFGASVALDGTRLAIGAPGGGIGEPYRDGKVYIYEWNGTGYVEVARVVASNATEEREFGTSVTMDGTRLVVGAPGVKNDDGPLVGKVYIYEWSGSTYNEVSALAYTDPNSLFGWSVALDGTRLAVGAPGNSYGGFHHDREVYIYEWNGTRYVEVTRVVASNTTEVREFGFSVALDGTRLVIGTPSAYIEEYSEGGVYIYNQNGTSYDEVAIFTAPGVLDWAGPSSSVAIDGTRLAIGEMDMSTSDHTSDKVHIYEWSGTTYDKVVTLTTPDSAVNGRFGWSVALDETRLAVGAPDQDTFEYDAGKVYIYEWNGATYVEVDTLTAPDTGYNGFFGSSVALDGTRLVVGADSDSTNDIAYAGKVYIYEWNGTSYDEVATVAASDIMEDAYFGFSVALDGTRLVVSAPGVETADSKFGKVYIYEWNGTSYVEVSTLIASDAEGDDYFGASVALDGTRLAVGAIDIDTGGKVYIYEWNGTEYVEVSTVTTPDGAGLVDFGWDIGFDGARLAVSSVDISTEFDIGRIDVFAPCD